MTGQLSMDLRVQSGTFSDFYRTFIGLLWDIHKSGDRGRGEGGSPKYEKMITLQNFQKKSQEITWGQGAFFCRIPENRRHGAGKFSGEK